MSQAATEHPVHPDLTGAAPQVALVGNPNTGKSTLFNRLTGIRQRVGNYPGVTVEKRVGAMRLEDETMNVLDLPGTYSLSAASADERVVIDVLAGRLQGTAPPDVVVCVVDSTNLMRNLFLASQIGETGVPVVLALNMWDAAEAQGMEIDPDLLAERFNVPVVPTVASRGQGIDALNEAIARALLERPKMSTPDWPDSVERAIDQLDRDVEADTGATLSRAELLRLLFDVDSSIPDRIEWPAGQRREKLDAARQILHEDGHNPVAAEAVIRYGHLGECLRGVITQPAERKVTRSESVDKILTHRVWGLVTFVAVMFVVFWSIYALADPIMGMIEDAFGVLGNLVAPALASMPMLQSLVVDGLIAGVGAVVVFLPQILILFFFIGLLEDTGYMARAAFLMDKLFSWCGLSGKSFVPMLSSFACAIPGIMATRTIEDRKARLTTILVAPLMSCSARLPVYVLLIAAFVQPTYGSTWAAVVLFLMHFVGLAVALPVALVLQRFILRGRSQTFVLEMPPYRVPQLRDVLWRMWERGREFLIRAGTVIFAMTVVIWVLTYFPRPEAVEQSLVREVAAEQNVESAAAASVLSESPELQQQLEGRYLEQSYLARFGKTVQPVFAPAGFDWKITVSVIASFPAREVIISTLGIIYNLGGDVDEETPSLKATMRAATWDDGAPVFTVSVALAIMVFFALCMQCGSTLAVIAREASWGWATFSFVYMTALAWIGAVVVYQAGSAVFS